MYKCIAKYLAITFLILFSQVVAAQNMSPKPTGNMSPIPGTQAPMTPLERLKKTSQEIQRDADYKKCEAENNTAREFCKNKKEGEKSGDYVCGPGGTVKPETLKSAHPDEKGNSTCVTQSEIVKKTGEPACANGRGLSLPEAIRAQGACPIMEVIRGWNPTKEEFDAIDKALEKKGVKCFVHRGPYRPEPTSGLNRAMFLAQAAGSNSQTGNVAFCPEDEETVRQTMKERTLAQAQQQPTTARPAGVLSPTPAAPAAQQPTTARPAGALSPTPAAPAAQQPTTVRPAGVLTESPFVPTSPQVTTSQPMGGSQQPVSQQPYQASQTGQQPTGVQTGRQQGYTPPARQQQEYTPPARVAQATPQRESWLSSWLSPKQESQPQQQQIVINNNNAQPWFIAEMKRMEDARLKAEQERKRLAGEQKKLREEKERAEKEKKLAKGTISKKTEGQKKEEISSEDVDPQAAFLKALMDAPSIEEITKQYEEEQKKESQQYVEERTKTIAVSKVSPTQQVVKMEQPSATQGKNPQLAVSAPQKRPQQAYTDVAPFVEKVEQNTATSAPTRVAKSSLVSMLDEEAIKKGIPAPRIEEMPLPEKIAFTRTSYTVVVPNIRQTIKTIMRAYQKGDLTQLERDRHAAQLIALSEQLAGSAYGADYDTTQVLNDAARATELTAFMIAEYADNKAVSDSLYGIFAMLTPLTKSEPVALTLPSGSLKEWSEQHFALIKYKIETAMEDTQSEKAKELYSKALSLVKSAELYKDSDQQYWNSSADIKEAVRTLSLATALDRASKESAVLEDSQAQEQKSAAAKAKTREALLKDKGQEKGIWGSFLNMLGL